MSLPLVTRKNIRDNEVHAKERLERIKNALGKDFELEVDWGTAIGQIDPSYKDRIGELYQKDVLENLAQNIERITKDNEMVKEALYEATSANKIIIRVNDKISDHWAMSFQNGALIIEHKKQLANLYSVSNFDLVKVMPTPGLPLATRLNLEKNKPKLEELLQNINELTGASDWTLEVDFDKVLPQLDAHTKDTIGDLYYNTVIEQLVYNLKRNLDKETIKESFNEATSQHKIIIEVNDKIPTWWSIKFNNGVLEISHKKSISNVYEISNYNLVEAIPSPGLPLVIRLNIESNRENLEQNLEKINKATDQSDWSVEADFEKILPQLEKSYQKTIGDLYYRDCLQGIANNIERSCKIETVKEAFNEATSQRKIIFKVDDKIKEWWSIQFQDGALVVTHKKSISNVYELANKQLAELIPSPGLPLVTRLNIDENREKLEQHLEVIREATGEDWTVEVDFEKAVKLLPTYQKTIGELYYHDVMYQLASNLKKKLQNETIKEAFNEAANQHKIVILVSVNPKENKNYWDIFFDNGALVIRHKQEVCNIYEISNYNIESVIPVPGLMTLMARLNIQEQQENLRTHLDTIKEATGEEYTLDDTSLEAVYKALPGKREQESIGDLFVNDAMRHLANNIKRRCADDMVKEALNEVVSNHQIVFIPDAKAPNYWSIKFNNGNIEVIFKPPLTNLYELENFDFEKLL